MIRRSLSTGLILLGGILLYCGYGKAQSFMGGMSRTLTGRYSWETLTYLLVGGILFLTGLFMLTGKKKGKKKR